MKGITLEFILFHKLDANIHADGNHTKSVGVAAFVNTK